jgi:uncharacterized protein (DUF934 family)
MSKQLIKNGQLVDDRWQALALDAEATVESTAALPVPAGPVLIPAPVWLAQRDALLSRADAGEVAVSLAPTFRVEDIAQDVQRFALIAVEFPKFIDGRGYSTARLLRERYAYRGELRAVGNIGRDQLFYLKRVGFDAFLIPPGQDAAAALQSLNDFPEVYQGAVDQPLPLFRRRTA